MDRRRLLQSSACALASAACSSEQANDETPLTWVVPFRAGGGTDQFARILQLRSAEYFGRAAVVQNRGGASGTIGWRHVMRQKTDGKTILFASPTPVSAVLLERTPPFSPFDLELLAYYSIARPIVFGGLGQSFDDWESFVAYVKAHPGEVTVGGALAVLLSVIYVFNQLELNVIYVPYPSTGATMADFAGGHIDVAIGAAGTIPRMRSRSNILANTANVDFSQRQRESLGDIFWVGDAGLTGFGVPRFLGVHPKTPEPVIEDLEKKFARLLSDPQVNDIAEMQGEEIIYLPRKKAKIAYRDFVTVSDDILKAFR